MKNEDRIQLARILGTVDEAFLVALANKGLVRRAEKDLEGVTLQIEETDDEIVVIGTDFKVWMPASGPTKARDDTKATGITRQIISATMYLRDHWAPKVSSEPAAIAVASAETIFDGPGTSAPEEATAKPSENKAAGAPALEGKALEDVLLAITVDELSRWAGKKIVSELIVLLKEPVEVEVESKLGVTIRLPQHNIEIRLLPSHEKGTKLLEQLLSTAPQALHKRWVATALLSLHQKAGKQVQLSEKVQDQSEAPRNQSQVLIETQKLLESMLDTGVSHPSTRVVERLFTLSISASVVQMPRLSHLLKTLSEEVSHLLSRHASGDTQRLFSTMSWTHSLVKSIQMHEKDVPRELVGVPRTQYDPAGDLELIGAGAYPWRSQSGFEGLTVLFWDPCGKRFLTWSTSRPTGTMGFIPQNIYQTDSIWQGGATVQRLSRSKFILKNARVNPAGRLSSGQQSSIESVSEHSLASQDFPDRVFSNWGKLKAYAVQQFPIGLKATDPLDRIVILEAKSWNDRFYDEMRQALCWDIVDDENSLVRLAVPWNDLNENAIHFLEELKPGLEKINRVVARINIQGTGFSIEPISFISPRTRSGDTILNPAFDQKQIVSSQSALLARLRLKYSRDKVQTTISSDDEWEEMLQLGSDSAQVPPQIRNALAESEGLLLQVAESGTQRLQEKTRQRFSELGEHLGKCGLVELGDSMRDVSRYSPSAKQVLWSDYLCKLHRQTISLALSNAVE